MKVAFDTRAASDTNGVGRYSRCLMRALRDTADPTEELLETQRPSALGRSRSPDVFHSPWMDGAMLHSPCPMVVTIHDLAPLKRRSEHLRAGLRSRLRHLAVQRAVSVIVPTEAVAADAVSYLHLDRARLVVIPEAADSSMYPRGAEEIAAARAQLGLPEHYMVWVGGLRHPHPGNNLAKLAAAPRALALVLVGASSPWARELPDVILTGQISDDQLAAVYSGAHALLVPSEDDGFGLPAVEALACGTPVVACDGPALREVLGGRATFVTPGDMEALIAAAQSARRPAPAPSSWTWEDAARTTWGVYAHAMSSAAGSRAAPARAAARRARAAELDGLEAQ